jgi:hypothetical protein
VAQTEVALRSTALRALRARKIDYYVDPEDPLYVDIVPTQEGFEPMRVALEEELSGKTVRSLWRHYRIPIHWFWNPLMIPGEEETGRPQ